MIINSFRLHKRPTANKNKFRFYAEFFDESKKWVTTKSSKQTSKTAARIWAIKFVNDSKSYSKENITFSKFSENWWIWDKCPYIKDKLNRGHSITPGHAENSRRNVDKYLIPAFGKMKLGYINYKIIKEWINKLINESKIKSSTINRITATLKVMLDEAVKQGLIVNNPAGKLGVLKEDTKRKTFLTDNEIHNLFLVENIVKVWNNDLKHYVLNLLGASTGIRLGEALALKPKDIHDNYIDIDKSWARKFGVKNTKTNTSRKVPITLRIKNLLDKLITESNTENTDYFIFFGSDYNRPLDQKLISKKLYDALEKIGITIESRKERNISFHSWRHYFNTVCRRKGIPDSIIREVTGHKTQEMTEHYTNYNFEALKPIIEIQETVI